MAGVACGINEEAKRLMPKTTSDLDAKFVSIIPYQVITILFIMEEEYKNATLELGAEYRTKVTNLQIAVNQSIVVDGLGINIPQNHADNGKTILSSVSLSTTNAKWATQLALLSPPSYTARAVTKDSLLRNALRSMKSWNLE